jgi:hypothetical protein
MNGQSVGMPSSTAGAVSGVVTTSSVLFARGAMTRSSSEPMTRDGDDGWSGLC